MEFLAENHPRIVHFAVALLFLYPLLEVSGVLLKKDFLQKAAHLILLFGVLAAVGGVLTGNQAHEVAMAWEDKGAMIPFKAINEHSFWANFTVWYFSALLVIRTFFVIKKKFIGKFRLIFVILSLAGLYLVYQTGDHGGKLVYKYGVGTELKKQEMEE
jgi:uncharacterized membrane protein